MSMYGSFSIKKTVPNFTPLSKSILSVTNSNIHKEFKNIIALATIQNRIKSKI